MMNVIRRCGKRLAVAVLYATGNAALAAHLSMSCAAISPVVRGCVIQTDSGSFRQVGKVFWP